PAHKDDEAPASVGTISPESDPAWRAFAESIRSWVAASTSGDATAPSIEDVNLVDRVLPLPSALRQAVTRQQWDADVLDRYDPAARQEFPLETRLWRYLQTLQSSSAGAGERDQARQAVQAWLDVETRSPAHDSPSWLPYLKQHWEALNARTDSALATGTEWLKDLLDRYQPLPAPLLV
ncbi:MAG: hypothetical protein WBO88_12425, partial [Candidatus Dechloromonas phosphoritropha]